jgi:4-hydroxy-3-polyprenylbenzoate decarboxylase
MGYPSLAACVNDLERQGELRRISALIDPHLEMAEVQRRVFAKGGPALLFQNPKGCQFPMLGNLFGTKKRVRFIFRDALPGLAALVSAKTDPMGILRDLPALFRLPGSAAALLPKFDLPLMREAAPVLAHNTSLSQLPKLVSWPDDGGAFVTLPQVYSEDPAKPGVRHSNLGMYRVQLTGNDYVPDREVGLHYQLHRGIGIHHTRAMERGERLPVSVFVGGPPAMTVAAVMPLPEGLPEIAFAGALNQRSIRMVRPEGSAALIHADADFCIRGYVDGAETKPEGPFGDHLGYYAKLHPFPVMHVTSVHHRAGAIWPFTVVGRPPQEDTMFGELIHELTGRLVPDVLPGVHAVHAVDAAGVHPLLLAIGSERYQPYGASKKPMELLTQAHAILGHGQMSLAKYLLMFAKDDAPELDIHDIRAFFVHLLERSDHRTDLHFHTNTTMDTLDYSGTGLNQGSKVAWVVRGPKRRTLATELPSALARALPLGFADPVLAMPGVVVVRAPRWLSEEQAHKTAKSLCAALEASLRLDGQDGDAACPLWVLADDSGFASRTFDNFLWTTFTRSNPAKDIFGVGEFVRDKAWGCEGPVVIDARAKLHHAPGLIEDPEVQKRVDALAVRGGPLHGLV